MTREQDHLLRIGRLERALADIRDLARRPEDPDPRLGSIVGLVNEVLGPVASHGGRRLPPSDQILPGDPEPTWDGWPDWVPAQVRAQIEGFWGPRSHRTFPDDWLADTERRRAPALGATFTARSFGEPPSVPERTGRFVHCWNNIGRLIAADGSIVYVSFHDDGSRRLIPR